MSTNLIFIFKTPLHKFCIIIMGRKLHKKGKTPPFIKKLIEILDNSQFKEYIDWLPEGNGFKIISVSKFIQEALPSLFKHNNFASFIRQLNMHGFFRPKESGQYVYCHPRFQKGNLNSIRFIQRKNRVPHPKELTKRSEEIISESQLKNKSEKKMNFSQMFNTLLKENQVLKKRNIQLVCQLQDLNKEFSSESRFSFVQKHEPSSGNVTLNEIPIIVQSNADELKKNQSETKSPSTIQCGDNYITFGFNCFPLQIEPQRPIRAGYRLIS